MILVTSHEKLDLTLIFSVTLLSVMGVSLISPSLPIIQQALQLSTEDANLIIVFFTLPGMLIAPLIGVAADRFGRKTLLVPSLFLFGLAGVSIPFAPSFHIILVLRFLQGTGAAGLSALAVTLIGDKFSGEKRAKYIGWNASILSIGTASYPLFGGLLTDTFSWTAPFYIFSLGILIGFLFILAFESPPPSKTPAPLRQYFGSALQDLLRPLLLASLLISFLTFILIYGSLLTYLSYYLHSAFTASSFQIGMIFSSSSIATGIVSSQTSWYQQKFTPPTIFALGFASFTISFLLVLILPSFPFFFLVSAFFGAAVGLILPSAQMFVISNVPLERRAGVTSVLTSITRGGQTVGPLFMSLIFYYTQAYKGLYFTLAVLTLTLTVILLCFTKYYHRPASPSPLSS